MSTANVVIEWYIEYVDNSPEKLQREAEKEKLAKHRKDDAERELATMQAMVERGKIRAEKKVWAKTPLAFKNLFWKWWNKWCNES